MTPIPLEEPTKKITDNQVTEWFQDLEGTFKKIPEIEKEEEPRTECCDSKFISETDLCSDCKEHAEPLEEEETPELIHKAMNNINTFHTYENYIYLSGTDEFGEDFTICFDAYNFLNWIDTEKLEYIKEKLIKHIKEK
tara:strand:- start:41 stop:454 length:414 start_codon:yes stop_codon:yes gene_type:complete